MANPSRTLAMGQDEATAAGRESVDAPFGQALVEAGRARPEIVGLTADLGKYTDMQELLLLDPVHEVDEAGWPNRA